MSDPPRRPAAAESCRAGDDGAHEGFPGYGTAHRWPSRQHSRLELRSNLISQRLLPRLSEVGQWPQSEHDRILVEVGAAGIEHVLQIDGQQAGERPPRVVKFEGVFGAL